MLVVAMQSRKEAIVGRGCVAIYLNTDRVLCHYADTYNDSVRGPISEQKKDTLTVHLDLESNLLFVGGYTGTDYMLPLIGKEGNYHTREIWLYRDFLRENMAFRAAKYMKKMGKNM